MRRLGITLCAKEEEGMPTYEYTCTACRKKFALTMTFSERDKKRVSCPKCRSRKVTQRFTSVYSQTSRKS
jgi:putative FmdB family regulatory protein